MIFCVEDDAGIRDLMIYALCSAGMQAEGFEDGARLTEALSERRPELIILDIMLPGEDGISILKRLKSRSATSSIPVIMATAKGTEYDKVIGLDLGADDYLAKPFDSRELLACVNALLRRQGSQVDELTFGNTTLDLSSGTLICGKENIRLSAIRSNVAIVAIRRLGYHLEVTTP